ncbi:MAG TPA: GNAT family N-acetyltransferase [Solirubrobacteraceae bacterium]|nr:GNAT family N-acetyltransferase [Solirubrobacteraceae bacterium]
MIADDRAAIRDLMRRAFGSHEAPLGAQRWEWLFGAPADDAPVHYLVADAGERLAGQYAGIPVRMQHRGERTSGLTMVDMATDPDYEHQGVYTALAREIYAASAPDAPIVFGFPNPTAAPFHYGRFDWVELHPFPFLARPLANVGRALRETLPGLAPAGGALDALLSPVRLFERTLAAVGKLGAASVQPLERFSAWTDELWMELSPALGTCVVRDADYLNWRFYASPYSYRRFALHRQGSPVGFAVSTFCPTRFGKLCYLMELMAPAHDRAGARLLLAQACLDATREGASMICTVATRRHPHRRAMLQTGFLPAPKRVRGHMSFGVRRNGEDATPNDLFHIDDWYLSGADRDTF